MNRHLEDARRHLAQAEVYLKDNPLHHDGATWRQQRALWRMLLYLEELEAATPAQHRHQYDLHEGWTGPAEPEECELRNKRQPHPAHEGCSGVAKPFA